MSGQLLKRLCIEVRQRRLEMGITQSRLGSLAGLSRAMIALLESTEIKGLSVARAERLLEVLGLELKLGRHGDDAASTESAIDRCLAIANRSQRNRFDSPRLKQALTSEVQLLDWGQHLRALIEDAPLGLLANMIWELNASDGVDIGVAWKKMSELSRKVGANVSYWS